MSKKHKIELSESDVAMLVTVIRMGGWHRKGDYPKHLRNSDNLYVKKMSKILKKLEDHLGDEDE